MIWILCLLGLYVAILIGAAWLSIHPFRTPVFISPSALGAAQEEVEFASGDGTLLRGWWVSTSGSETVAVLAHGYVMNRSELTPLAVWLWERGISALVFDLRAHGRSGGRTCGFGVREKEDVKAAVSWVRSRVPSAKILLVGSSMGAAACTLAAEDSPGLADGLVLDSCYSNLSSAVAGWWRFLGGEMLRIVLAPVILIASPLARINPYRVDVARSLKSLTMEVLIFHGSADDLATADQARRNLEACGDRGELVWLEGCGHSEGRWVHGELYYREMERFLLKLRMLPTAPANQANLIQERKLGEGRP